MINNLFLKCLLVASISLLSFFSNTLGAAKNDNKTPILQSLNGDFSQGGLVIGQALPNSKIIFEGKELTQNIEGYFVFGFHRDMPESAVLTLEHGGKKIEQKISIRKRDYAIEQVGGLPPSKISPRKPEVLARIKREGQKVAQARAKSTKINAFMQSFIWPAKGRLSGFYGSQRVLNGVPKRPHYGLDIAAKTGTPIIAPADGVVRLAEKDLFFSGGTLILDHGFGVSSSFIHLNSIEVEVGQQIKQGETIATIGQTGRATGPHLDWRINWFGSRLDPQLLVPPLKANKQK